MKKLNNNKETRSLVTLSHLAGMLDCSLARYLLGARPWVRRPYLLLGAVARRLASEHEYHAGEIVRLLDSRRYNVNNYTYPMEFTYYNDLSLEFLAPRLLDHQHRLINFATAASNELKGDYEVERVLGKLLTSLRKYGSLLQELLAPHRFTLPKTGEGRPAAPIAGSAPPRANKKTAASTESQAAA
jgi:hypothetical protein